MYTTVVLMGFGAFVSVWLLVKVGRGWRVSAQVQEEGKERTLKETEEKIPRVEGARYNIFLIGNALSIMFGVFGALIIRYLPRAIMLSN